MALDSQLAQAIKDVRFNVMDNSTDPRFVDKRIIKLLGSAWDDVIEDIGVSTASPFYSRYDLALVSGQREYLVPTGVGHIVEIGVYDKNNNFLGVHPCFNQDNIRGQGWDWSPPFLVFDRAPASATAGTLRIIFIPRASDYMHQGAIQQDDIVNAGYSKTWVLTLSSGASGNFTVKYRTETTANIATTATAGTVETAIEALASITGVTVTGDAGGPWTIAAGTPTVLAPFTVASQPSGGGTLTIAASAAETVTTVKLDTSPTLGEFDQRPNGFIGGMLRIYDAADGMTDHTVFPWQERRGIGYNAKDNTLTLNAAFDGVVNGLAAGSIKYEIVPLVEPAMFELASIRAAARVLRVVGERSRVQLMQDEYEIQKTTLRRQLGKRNHVKPIGPTSKIDRKTAGQLVSPIRVITSDNIIAT